MFTKEDNARMISTPDEWPQWPLLPVKRFKSEEDHTWNNLETGVIHAAAPTRVRVINLWGITEEAWEKAEKYEYASAQHVVDAGWVVD